MTGQKKKKVTNRITVRQVTNAPVRQVTNKPVSPEDTQATENYEFFTQGTTKASGQITESRVLVGQVS